MRRTTIFALLASALMLLSVAAPALATGDVEDGSLSVSVSQDSSGEATVSVTAESNNSSVAVEGASVTVETVDDNATYEGTGEYTSDENGTVTLPAPNETVDVAVTAAHDNQTAETTATLEAGEEDDGNATAFGERVSSFVHQLQDENNTSDAPFGTQVAAFVVANNPGNAPAHAGPPEWLVNDSVNKTTGPPEHAGPPENKSGGPPENKSTGPPDDKGPDKDKDGGPPDHAGNDDGDEEDEEDDSDG